MAGNLNKGVPVQQAPFAQMAQPLGQAPSWMSGTTSPMGDVPVQRKRRKLTRFEQARMKITVFVNTEETRGVDWYYTPVAVGDVIEALGWWNPIHGGRPKHYAQMLLNGIPSAAMGQGYRWKGCGLMYFTPPSVGRMGSRNRTSIVGLSLLRHWALSFPRFQPFFDAYWSAKAEQQITLDCVDFMLNVLPVRYRETIARNEERVRTDMAVKMKQAQAAAAQATNVNNFPNLMSQQNSQQSYQQMMAQVSQQNSLYPNMMPGQSSQSSGLLGSLASAVRNYFP